MKMRHRISLRLLLLLVLIVVSLSFALSAQAASARGEDQFGKMLRYQASQASSSAERACRSLKLPSPGGNDPLSSQVNHLKKQWNQSSNQTKRNYSNAKANARNVKSAGKNKNYTADVRIPTNDILGLPFNSSPISHQIYFIAPVNHSLDDGGMPITMEVFQLRATRKGNLIILFLLRNNNGHDIMLRGINKIELADGEGIFAAGYPDAFRTPITMKTGSLILLRMDFYPGTWRKSGENPTRDDIRVFYSFNYNNEPAALPTADTGKKYNRR